MSIYHIAVRDVKSGLRNPWSYSFMAIFALFMIGLLMINAQGYLQGYSGITGTMINLILYLLPLMSLLLGSFSLSAEKEEGSWELLSSYPISTWTYILGKYIGLSVVLLLIVATGFGLAGISGLFTAGGFALKAYAILLVFSCCLALFFLAIAMIAGSIAKNRWQALTYGVAVWFFAIIGWAPIMIAFLGFLQYPLIKPMVTTLTFLNPAELSRLFTVVKLGGGAILGPEYYDWVKWIRRSEGTYSFIGVAIVWIGISITTACYLWERGRTRV
ncbi:ABC transporter permease [Paenibacillus sp. YAF4_2]|uniref:ABC transporter permease n=1 Tax=Paenibacillus sp. YAF4_2 TaxID=3233085 RepID=UPI003F9E974F